MYRPHHWQPLLPPHMIHLVWSVDQIRPVHIIHQDIRLAAHHRHHRPVACIRSIQIHRYHLDYLIIHQTEQLVSETILFSASASSPHSQINRLCINQINSHRCTLKLNGKHFACYTLRVAIVCTLHSTDQSTFSLFLIYYSIV